MTYMLAVFRSRSQAIDCNRKLKCAGINSALVNTPKEAHIGCGLSVKVDAQQAERAKRLIIAARFTNFYGFMNMNTVCGSTFISPMR